MKHEHNGRCRWPNGLILHPSLPPHSRDEPPTRRNDIRLVRENTHKAESKTAGWLMPRLWPPATPGADPPPPGSRFAPTAAQAPSGPSVAGAVEVLMLLLLPLTAPGRLRRHRRDVRARTGSLTTHNPTLTCVPRLTDFEPEARSRRQHQTGQNQPSEPIIQLGRGHGHYMRT